MAGEFDVSQGRSPRYPRFPLLASVNYARKLYDGAHRSTVDTLTAYRVMGFAGKSGASATALGATRQFGLVESSKGGVRISDLGLSVLQPSSDEEYISALHQAAKQPQVFEQILSHFDELPRSDEPIRSYLIRNLGFSKSGADDCIAALRETLGELPSKSGSQSTPESIDGPRDFKGSQHQAPVRVPSIAESAHPLENSVMRFPLTRDCEAELRFSGPLSAQALDRLGRHIELLKDVWSSEE